MRKAKIVPAVSAALLLLGAAHGAPAPTPVTPETKWPPDWPGKGDVKDWDAACLLNDQANRVMEGEYPPGSTVADRAVVNKAVALYQKAIQTYPYETAFYDGLAKCYEDLGEEDLAEATYRKSVEVKEKYRGPQNKIRYPDTYLSLARLCAKHKKFQDADLYFKKACEHWKTVGAWKEYAAFLRDRDRLEESSAALRKANELQEHYERNSKTPFWPPGKQP